MFGCYFRRNFLTKNKMNITKTFILALLATTLVVSCSKTKKLTKGVTGKWNISSWNLQKKVNGSPALGSFIALNTGTIELTKERTGSATVPVGMLGTTVITRNLQISNWYNDAKNVTLFYNTDKDTNIVYHFDVNTDIEDTLQWEYFEKKYDPFSTTNDETRLKIKLYQVK